MKIRRHHYLLAICLLLLPYRVPAHKDAALQPFTVDHRKALLAHLPVDVSFLLDAPAGKHGFVRAQGGHFVTGYGKRILFWGMNITDWSKGSVTAEVTGQRIQVEECPRRAGDFPVLVASSDRIRRELHWEPQVVKLEDIIGSAWSWRQQHPRGYKKDG
jgi:hypothetical protein